LFWIKEKSKGSLMRADDRRNGKDKYC